MPPLVNSRYQDCFAIEDENNDNKLFLTERKRFLYSPDIKTRRHIVKDGETVWKLAGRYYPEYKNMFWVICDFQPVPINDPTLDLEPGRELLIPSQSAVKEFLSQNEMI